MQVQLLIGDCRTVLATLPDRSVQCCVTSPPYYGLRDYGTATWIGGDPACDHRKVTAEQVTKYRASSTLQTKPDNAGNGLEVGYRDCCGKCGAKRIDQQIGLEASIDAYIDTLVTVFREVRRVLRDDGTVWLNIGDSYAAAPSGGFTKGNRGTNRVSFRSNTAIDTSKLIGRKQLLMIPARLAIALQADGWIVRSDIVWHKPSPLPESVKDRPTNSYEHVFMLSKRSRYYYDREAIREPCSGKGQSGGRAPRYGVPGRRKKGGHLMDHFDPNQFRNSRNVWTMASQPYPGAHFAVMPVKLAERCIRAGSQIGDVILDPFGGVGTTALAALRLDRKCILIELSEQYAQIARERLAMPSDAGETMLRNHQMRLRPC
jgi:site-specific DNA-methyltransferase (cytosine-N4-specific)